MTDSILHATIHTALGGRSLATGRSQPDGGRRGRGHNGIEYGLMAAYAEGLNILKHADAGLEQRTVDAETSPLRDPESYQYQLDLGDIADTVLSAMRMGFGGHVETKG